MTQQRLPYWYYAGRVTTPVNIPGQGPVVIKPRSKFHAPVASVSHLMKTKSPLVKRLPDPPVPTEETAVPLSPPAALKKESSKEESPADSKSDAPNETKQSAPENGAGSASDRADVVASDSVAAEADEEEGKPAEGEDTSSVSEESESEPHRRKRKRSRRTE